MICGSAIVADPTPPHAVAAPPQAHKAPSQPPRRQSRAARRRPGPRIAQAVPFCAGGAKSRIRSYAAGPPTAPNGPNERVRASLWLPVGGRVARILDCPDAVAVRGNRLTSPSEVEATETAASDIFGGAAASSGLRLPPPSLGAWKTRKNAQTTINLQEATCGGHPRSAGGLGSDPSRPDLKFGWLAAPGD